MHSFRNFHSLVAVALFLGSAVSSPCKPLTSTTLSLTQDPVTISSIAVESISEVSATSSSTDEAATETALSTASETTFETFISTTTGAASETATETATTSAAETTTSDITTTTAEPTTTTSVAPVATPAGQTWGLKAAGQNQPIDGAVLHVSVNSGSAVFLISPPRTQGTLLPGTFYIEQGTGRLKTGTKYIITNSPEPYSMYASEPADIRANVAFITCAQPLLVGDPLLCSSETAGPLYFTVSTGASASNIMPWKVGSVHAGYTAFDLVVS
ncbi:hypothetical protein ACHAPJ_005281 [Fusarium lateritium]